MNELVLYSLLGFAVLSGIVAIIMARSWPAWLLFLVVFVALATAQHLRAGWPVNQLPPQGAVVLGLAGGAAWAIPADAETPRSYSLPPDLYEKALREFYGRSEEGTGEADTSPMEWQDPYDLDGGEGTALVQRERPTREKEQLR